MTRCRALAATFSLTFAIGCAMSCAVAAAPAALAAPSAAAVTKGQAASGWLARQMTGRSHFTTVFDGVTYPDQGLTIDAIFAFAATGTANDYAARATTWLEKPSVLSGYIGNGTTESYAGATAKVALAAEVRGIKPASFGKVDLLSRLAALLTKSGRYSDHSSFGDFSNAFSQSLAILAVSRATGKVPAKAVSFLIGSECQDGGFPLYFAQKTCVSDPDATGMDVQALLAAGRPVAAQRGLRWLAKAQRADGGFAASASAAPNANSTGLAGEALAAGKWRHRAGLAASFLLGLQVGCSGKASERGAIAYDKTGFAASTAPDATAQGLLGVEDAGLATLSAHGAKSGAPHLGCAS
jgi:hypothetical protein